MMRGVGGPLLCIGDLLSDVGDGDGGGTGTPSSSSSSPPSSSYASPSSMSTNPNPSDPIGFASDLNQLFQENYKKLNEALEGTDHSWTALTLKLCSALDAADKLVQTANSNSVMLAEKVGVLHDIIRRGDSAVASLKSIHGVQGVAPERGRLFC